MYINKVILIGNLTQTPELKALPSGIKVCEFSLATNRTWKDTAGQKQEAVEYHNVKAFAKTGETISMYCKKGDQIYVEGRLETRSWEKDGAKYYKTEIVAEMFQFGQKKSNEIEEPKVEKTLQDVSQTLEEKEQERLSKITQDDEGNYSDIPFK